MGRERKKYCKWENTARWSRETVGLDRRVNDVFDLNRGDPMYQSKGKRQNRGT